MDMSLLISNTSEEEEEESLRLFFVVIVVQRNAPFAFNPSKRLGAVGYYSTMPRDEL